ncbi:MAG: hypothetical protein Q9170_007907 [Blastenia crenularia]
MSAVGLGSTLLEETDETKLLHTLRSAREDGLGHAYTGQQVIDQLLQAFLYPNHLQSRPYAPPNVAPVLPSDQRNIVSSTRAPVLELVGASPCSGKTQLLYHLVGLVLLPGEHEGVSLGGKSSAVILFDLASSLSVLRLRDVMINHVQTCIRKTSEPASEETIATLVRSSLDHLHLFRPHTSRSLLATLSNLHSYIFNTTAHISANRQVGSIILHHIDAFLWQDRLEDAEDETNEGALPHKSTLLSRRFHDLVTHLRRLQTDFSCLIIATSSALSTITYSRVDGRMVPSLRSHLPNIWRGMVTVRLIVQRDEVRKFPLGVSAEEAAREAQQRREVVEKCGFSAMLDWGESEGWRGEVRNMVKGLKDGGEFAFMVTERGVEFEVGG